MLKRYALPEMEAIWSDQNKFKIWFEIEAFACEALHKLGLFPAEVLQELWDSQPSVIDVDRIVEIEKEIHHESIAFQSYVAEICPSIEKERYHHGLTSSDVLDTSFCLQLSQAGDLISEKLSTLCNTLKLKAFEYKNTPCIGRSHGVHAEPTTFGLKFARAFAEMNRNLERLSHAKSEIAFGMLSGPVGNYTNVDPFVEEYVCQKLGLHVEPISSQIIPRDRFAYYFATLSIIASSIERFCVELRLLQITEVNETKEPFQSSQKGSSAMPHKKNPILLENLSGLARIIKSHVNPALDNVALWHERDMSHSSVERFIGPDTTITLDFAIHRLNKVVAGLEVNESQLTKNLNHLKGLTNSQPLLLLLIEKGVEKGKAYRMVQSLALKVSEDNFDFKTEILESQNFLEWVTVEEIDSIFDSSHALKNIDTIFDRVFNF